MSRWSTAALVLLLAPLLVRADLKQYIDEQTLFAAEADLTKVNAAQLESFLRDAFKEAGITGGKNPVLSDVDQAKFIGHVNSWLLEVSRAGGKNVYVVTHMGLIKDGGMAVIMPAAPGGDAKKLASLLYSGKPNGPTSQPAANRWGGGERYARRAEVINGNVAVFGTGNAITYAKMIRPAPRPDMEAALAAIGDAPIRAVVAPTVMVRALMGGGLPEKIFDQPSSAVSQDIQWVAAAATLPPAPSVKIIAKTSSAEAAKQVHHIVTYGLASMSGVPPQISPDLAKIITPTIANDQLTLSADPAKLIALAKELVPPMRLAREQAMRVASMSNMRQILMGCNMHAADNKGAWPEDLKGLQKYLKAPQVFKNPARPELDPAYIYIKPKNVRQNTGTTMVLYESHKNFGNGVSVGFVDGHVEWIVDKKRFDQLLAETAVAN